MKRITITVSNELDWVLHREARRRDTSVSEVARDAMEASLLAVDTETLPFANLGDSGQSRISENFEEILAQEWTPDSPS